MRLMLGRNDVPDLLVTLEGTEGENEFYFRVVNGGWKGKFTNGYVTTEGCPSGDFTSLDKMEVICDDQDRLYGDDSWDYQTVFNEYHNPQYKRKRNDKYVPQFDDLDDDIPF